jgi:hypothetical protein
MKFKDALDRLKLIADTLPEDDPDREEMLNVEGDYSKLMEWAITKRNECLFQADACKALADKYAARKKAIEKRGEDMKSVMEVIMSCANETKYVGTATVSVREVKPKPIVQDENKVPNEYKKTTVSIDKTAINKAVKDGKTIAGVVMDNGSTTLTIRI